MNRHVGLKKINKSFFMEIGTFLFIFYSDFCDITFEYIALYRRSWWGGCWVRSRQGSTTRRKQPHSGPSSMESVGRLPAMGGGECEEPDAAVAPVPSSAKKKNKTTWLPPSKRHAGWSSCASAAPAQQRNTSRHHYDHDDDDALPFGRAPFCLVVGHERLASLPRPHTLPRRGAE